MHPFVSILVPMRNEEAFIADCLASLRAQDYPADQVEILVLDGASTDRSPEIVRAIAAEDPRVRLLPNPERIQAAAMNLGIAAARGEIVVRADAHARYGPAYVRTCVEHLVAGRGDNVGGLQRAVGETPFGQAVAAAMQTPLGAGNAPYRVATTMRLADTVWLGAWYTQTLRELGGFNAEMIANEDYELNCRLRARGGRVLLDPALEATYYPRTSPSRLWRQYFRYGRAKVHCLRLHPKTLALRQAVPPLAVLAMILSAAAIPLTPWPFTIIGGLYAIALVLGSLQGAARGGWATLPYLPLIYVILHFAWGLGFGVELLRGSSGRPCGAPRA